MAFWHTNVKAKTWKRAPDPGPKKEEPKPDPPKPPPEAIRFRYRSPTDAVLEAFSPYLSAISLGGIEYQSPAHLYWSIAFAKHPAALHQLQSLSTAATAPEQIAMLLNIINVWGQEASSGPGFLHRRIHIMHGIQALKFAQHPELREQLLATGEAPLVYDQANTRVGETMPNDPLGIFAAYVGAPSVGIEGPFVSTDDTFWGTDPLLDPEGKHSNHLGKILMDLRKRFKDESDRTLELCTSLSQVLEGVSPRM